MTPTVPQPLLELLRDATARGRPALTLTFARVAELLGEMPPDGWWHHQRAALRSSGYDAAIDHERRWVSFEPAAATEPLPGDLPSVTVDVRVTFEWAGDGATKATAWVDGVPTPVDLSAESAGSLAAVARGRTPPPDDLGTPGEGRGGGSGI